MNRFQDWLEQARANLSHAEGSVTLGDHAWACFAAHQSAESAAKALHLRVGQVAWGHSVVDLLAQVPEPVRPGPRLLERAKALDRFYIPTRYPDAHPAGSAARHYTAAEAADAILIAREVLEHCERKSLEAG